MTAICPECLCDWPLHAASCSCVPPPRRREVDWLMTILFIGALIAGFVAMI